MELFCCSSNRDLQYTDKPAINWKDPNLTGDQLVQRAKAPEVTKERRAWGKRYREFAMKFFNLERYAYEHQQQCPPPRNGFIPIPYDGRRGEGAKRKGCVRNTAHTSSACSVSLERAFRARRKRTWQKNFLR